MTIIAAALKHMLAAGMPAEAIVAAVAEMEAEIAAQIPAEPQPSKGALRAHRYRERGGGQVSPLVRQQVFERDGYLCLDCGSGERLEADHIIPVSKGGETSMDNLQTLCRSCNARKRDRIRKADERGQSRTISDKSGKVGISEEVCENPAPPLSLSPNENNSNPHTHTPEGDTPGVPTCEGPRAGPIPGHMLPSAVTLGMLAYLASLTASRTVALNALWHGTPPPDRVSDDVWTGYLAHRKAHPKAGKLTPRAYTLLRQRLIEWEKLGVPPDDALDRAIERQWITVLSPKESRNDRTPPRGQNYRGGPGHRPVNGFDAALRDAERSLSGNCPAFDG